MANKDKIILQLVKEKDVIVDASEALLFNDIEKIEGLEFVGVYDIVDEANLLAGVNGTAPPEGAFLPLFVGKYAAHAELFCHLKSEDNTPGGRSGYYLDLLFPEVVRDYAAELLGIVGILQNPELLPVDRRV